MSDLFQRLVPDDYVRTVADVMLAARWHTYQVLTKRADRLRAMLHGPLHDAAEAEHIWWGVSVEDRKYGLPRVRELQKAPARVRFLSVEPLLEDLGELDLAGIHWVIVDGDRDPKKSDALGRPRSGIRQRGGGGAKLDERMPEMVKARADTRAFAPTADADERHVARRRRGGQLRDADPSADGCASTTVYERFAAAAAW